MILSGSSGSFAHAWFWKPFCIGTLISVVTSDENKGIGVHDIYICYVLYIYTYLSVSYW